MLTMNTFSIKHPAINRECTLQHRCAGRREQQAAEKQLATDKRAFGNPRKQLLSLNGYIVLNQVSFTYPDTKEAATQDFSSKILTHITVKVNKRVKKIGSNKTNQNEK
mgnify:CR=1 FL=1